ncbi:MAG TPA: deoxyribodipyrimidine photo-lyase, partial [Thermodesulfobacteriota bacterium]|nr:deoxyribodipyrimidine photo-lyase [Thermodesulfobacteriota bacterium]
MILMDTRKASPPSPAPAASARIRKLNRKEPVEGDFVLYWMQQSQRAEGNDALEYAIRKANLMDIPVVVAFGLTANYPEANLRHYVFMLEGLREVGRKLRARNIRFVVQHGQPPDVALRLGRHATAIVCDRGYLTHQKEWRAEVARRAKCAVEEVECDAIVPVGLVSEKREAAARTFRPRVSKLAGSFLRRLPAARPAVPSADFPLGSLDLNDEGSVLERLSIDTSVKPVPHFTGGTDEAKKRLAEFIRRRLTGYGENRGRPETDNVSQMSPYLHFGQVSPVYIARKISEQEAKAPDDCRQYLDELIVSRELSFHFVHHTPDYDRFSSIPEWARATLKKHANDKRGYLYGRNELEAGKTHDPYWNAAMEEMK